jgi:hypothetical protein
VDGRATTIAQLQVPGDEIGVKVAQEHVADLETEAIGVCQVLLDVALRIDDNRRRAGLVANQIGGMRKAAQIILFQDHWNVPLSQAQVVHPLQHCPALAANHRRAIAAHQRPRLPAAGIAGNRIPWRGSGRGFGLHETIFDCTRHPR